MTKLFTIIDLLDIEIQAQGKPSGVNAVQMLCQSASVSYKHTLLPEQLEAAITQGDAAQLQALIAQASQARSAWQLGEVVSRTDPNQRLPSADERQED